jgi:hypothetical protein
LGEMEEVKPEILLYKKKIEFICGQLRVPSPWERGWGEAFSKSEKYPSLHQFQTKTAQFLLVL